MAHLQNEVGTKILFESRIFSRKMLRKFPRKVRAFILWENESIYLHRSGPLLENGLEKPENYYGRYGLASFSSIAISTVGVDGARVSL